MAIKSVAFEELGLSERELLSKPAVDRKKALLDHVAWMVKTDIEDVRESIKKPRDISADRPSLDRSETKLRRAQRGQDIFEWLKVPTEYENLKRMLRSKLVQLLTDDGNCERITTRVLEYDRERASNPRVRPQDMVLNAEFFNNKPLERKRPKSVRESRDAFVKDSKKIDTFLLNQIRGEVQTVFKNNDVQKSFTKYNVKFDSGDKWSSKKEIQYLKRKDETFKSTFPVAVGICSSPNLIDCGFSKFIIEHVNTKNTKEIRNELLNKWIEGETLKPNELRYLTYTSETLNRFLDKHVYQTAVRMMDPTIIENLEVLLAEEILSGYYLIKDRVRDERMAYLNEKNAKYHDKVAWEREQVVIRNQSQTNLYQRIRQQKCARSQSELRLKRVAPAQTINIALKYGRQLMNKTIMRPDAPLRQRGYLKATQSQNRMVCSTFLGRTPLKEYRSIIHPPSKLVISEKDLMYERQLTAQADEGLGKAQVEEAYKMETLRHQHLLDPQKFKQVYSMGPRKTGIKPSRGLKEKAATIIQRFWRGYISRRKFRQMKDHLADKMSKAVKKVAGNDNLTQVKDPSGNRVFKAVLRAYNLKKVGADKELNTSRKSSLDRSKDSKLARAEDLIKKRLGKPIPEE